MKMLILSFDFSFEKVALKKLPILLENTHQVKKSGKSTLYITAVLRIKTLHYHGFFAILFF